MVFQFDVRLHELVSKKNSDYLKKIKKKLYLKIELIFFKKIKNFYKNFKSFEILKNLFFFKFLFVFSSYETKELVTMRFFQTTKQITIT